MRLDSNGESAGYGPSKSPGGSRYVRPDPTGRLQFLKSAFLWLVSGFSLLLLGECCQWAKYGQYRVQMCQTWAVSVCEIAKCEIAFHQIGLMLVNVIHKLFHNLAVNLLEGLENASRIKQNGLMVVLPSL